MSLASRRAEAQPLGGPRFLDRRFDAAGAETPCPGNTVICHITDKAAINAITAAQHRLAEHPGGARFAWLPRSSLHCTLFNGVLYAERAGDFWPRSLPNDAPRAQADAHMARAFDAVTAPERPLSLAVGGFSGLGSDALGIALRPDAASEAALRAYRDQLAEACGLAHRPGHARYAFHITLGYLIGWPTAAEAEAFDTALDQTAAMLTAALPQVVLDRAEFCTFAGMTRFDVQAAKPMAA